MTENQTAPQIPQLHSLLLQKFIWMDQALQENREFTNGPKLSRAESHVMALVANGIQRPVEVARELGMSRQAVNVTINLLKGRGLIKSRQDPDDKRCTIIYFAKSGQPIRQEAINILRHLEEELQNRLGKKTMRKILEGLSMDWGPIPQVKKETCLATED